MRLARVRTATGPQAAAMIDGAWVAVESVFDTRRIGGQLQPAEGDFLAPVMPGLVMGMLHNSGAADRELAPQAFLKSSRTVVAPGDPIVVDPRLGEVKGEGEVVLVVGKECHDIEATDAPDYILGWTIANDVTAVDQGAIDETRTTAKNGTGFTPLGPWIETDIDGLNAPIEVSVGSTVVANSNSNNLAWNPYEVLAWASKYTTLAPGDIILTGAPGTAWTIEPGDTMSITIGGIGTLTNPVVKYSR